MQESQGHLYRRVAYSGDGENKSQLAFLETLISNPPLALLVLSFSSDSSASIPRRDEPEETTETPERQKLWRRLPHALRLMVNLEKLRFREKSGQPSAFWILSGVRFQLKVLEWGSHREGVEMASFLATQHHLESITLEEGPSCPLDPSACSKFAP